MGIKKVVIGAFAAVVMSVGLAVGAKADDPRSEITGVVTENFTAVAGADVTVTCNGHTATDKTDAFGSYLVHFKKDDCPFGSTVKVVAKKDGKAGAASGTMQGITTKLNLAIVNVSIPEYGTIGLIGAAGAGLGILAFMRRRQQQADL